MLSPSHQMSLPFLILLLIYTSSGVMTQDINPTTLNSISTYPGEKVYPLCFQREKDRINMEKFEQCCYRYALCKCVKKECSTPQYADDYDCNKNWWWQATCTTSYNASCPRIFDDASFRVTCPGLDPDVTTYDDWPHNSNHSADGFTGSGAAATGMSTWIIVAIVIGAILLALLLLCLYCKYCTGDDGGGKSHKPKTRSSKKSKKSSVKASPKSKSKKSSSAKANKSAKKKSSVRSKGMGDGGKFGLLTPKKGGHSSKK